MYTQINNFSIAYSDQGKGLPVALIHGYPLNRRIFELQSKALSQHARIITPDLRGHGLTRLPADPQGRRGWHDHRDDLIALLEALDGPPAVMAGPSTPCPMRHTCWPEWTILTWCRWWPPSPRCCRPW